MKMKLNAETAAAWSIGIQLLIILRVAGQLLIMTYQSNGMYWEIAGDYFSQAVYQYATAEFITACICIITFILFRLKYFRFIILLTALLIIYLLIYKFAYMTNVNL